MRQIFIYRGLEGLSHADTARVLGISPEAAPRRWQRPLLRLKSLSAQDDLLAH